MAYIHTHSTLQDQMNKAQLVLVSQTWCRDQMESNQASATPKRRAHSFFCKLYLKPQTAAPGSIWGPKYRSVVNHQSLRDPF